MSSCAASCSTCCRQASCASATSGSSPTGTELLCCRCACDCSADHSKTQLRRHHRPQIRLILSGAAQSAVEPCTLSNGSLPRNSCFVRHLNQTGTQHEALFTSSVTARASARTQIPCLILSGLLGRLSLQPSTDASLRCFTEPSHRQSGTSYPTRPVPDPSAPAQADSKYIAFHKGGFLQVAVSEAPHGEHADAVPLRGGRSRYSTKTSQYQSFIDKCIDDFATAGIAGRFLKLLRSQPGLLPYDRVSSGRVAENMGRLSVTTTP